MADARLYFTSRSLYFWGLSSQHLLNMRFGGPQSLYRRCGEEKKYIFSSVDEIQILRSFSHYTDWAILAPVPLQMKLKFCLWILNFSCSVVGIATSYGLDDRWVGVRVPVDWRIFSKSSRPALRSTQRVPWALYPGVKRPGPEVDHSPPTSAEVKKMWIYTCTPIRHHVVMRN
jgi:hypothetical protein